MVNKDRENGDYILLSEFRRESSNLLKNRENILNRIQNLLMFDALIITLIFSLYVYRYGLSGKYSLVVSMLFIITSMLVGLYYLVAREYFVGFTTFQLAELKSFPKIDTEEIRDRIIFELGIDNILTNYQNLKLSFGRDVSIYALFLGMFFIAFYVLFGETKFEMQLIISIIFILVSSLVFFLFIRNQYKPMVKDTLNRHEIWTDHVVFKKKWNFADLSEPLPLEKYKEDLKNIASSIPYIVYWIDPSSGEAKFRINYLSHGRIFKLFLPKKN
ncbi:MAG: hypothetical protein KJ886_02475 [Candidatus Thermoplasmatota archaeon]|nr:hypothetical protein [Candidatus Thermoplasmatota archaeon]MCG2825447.1 hypothetical protein [Thermoplasmatales archaeon]